MNIKQEKHMLEVRGKVRELYMNSGISMEEILEVIAYDACYFLQHEGFDKRKYDFWLHIEKDLMEWRKNSNNKSLKIHCPDWNKTGKKRVWNSGIEIS